MKLIQILSVGLLIALPVSSSVDITGTKELVKRHCGRFGGGWGGWRAWRRRGGGKGGGKGGFWKRRGGGRGGCRW